MNYDEFCEVYGPPSPLFKYNFRELDLCKIRSKISLSLT